MDYKLIKCEKLFDGAVFKVVLNAPKANILEAAMLGEISCALDGLCSEKDLKLIVFEGEGKHFSFGASVPEHTKENAAMMLKAFHGVFFQLVRLSVPVMAIVRGQCLGGGMELALFCNFIVADGSAMFGQPEIMLGVFPPPASVMLTRKVGQTYADDMVLTGRSVSAAEAQKMGLITLLAEEGQDAWETASQWIEKHILPKSAESLRIANRAVRMDFFRAVMEDFPRMEGLYLKDLMESHDANEGITAFIEKRKPVWQNR
ncbi:enoyl-CoA hydratase-related protein [Desulfomonile tiedjei]|uniref:Enoyl-CoA hydratase/carnithine racemase n=1 Tax=Desulfomonile tiedjei (strain ATCC 49306 / DSM 6799 / DCB-1) TaxID=706587 RepID=I4C3Q1_DESTA|nr:enoyl-CoA hydratase-related protein [Desulfomonile tiedjei]AFM24192.1 enoyl-CoA hydratase/carnithine racemase [Desulfomonile tiedjei DSM 6799]